MTYAPADQAFADTLKQAIPDKAFRDPEPRYFEEPRGKWRSDPGMVLAPGSVEEVRTILMACNAAGVRVVPYGGGTGLVGGQIAGPGPAPVILTTDRLNAIRSVHPDENVMVVEAGVILEDIHTAAARVDRLFPLSIAAKGTARIGGNLGTNAGGVNVLRYGNTRELCLGIEAVLPDGRMINGLSRLRKDNTGYDLKDLMIGSEGTLGVITAAALKLAPVPAEQGTAVFVVNDPEAALKLLTMARSHVGEGVSAFELIAGVGLDFLAEHLPQVRRPFAENPAWTVLIDLGLGRGLDPQAALEDLFAEAAEAELVTDGVIAQSEGQRQELWDMREHLPEANRKVGSVCSHDVSLPLGNVAEFIRRGDQLVASFGPVRVNCFGHLGDGNLHYNIFPPPGAGPAEFRHLSADITGAVHELVHELDGSFSAEHGVGRLKVKDLERYGDPVKIELMRGIKALFDPKGIMNPGAVLA